MPSLSRKLFLLLECKELQYHFRAPPRRVLANSFGNHEINVTVGSVRRPRTTVSDTITFLPLEADIPRVWGMRTGAIRVQYGRVKDPRSSMVRRWS